VFRDRDLKSALAALDKNKDGEIGMNNN